MRRPFALDNKRHTKDKGAKEPPKHSQAKIYLFGFCDAKFAFPEVRRLRRLSNRKTANYVRELGGGFFSPPACPSRKSEKQAHSKRRKTKLLFLSSNTSVKHFQTLQKNALCLKHKAYVYIPLNYNIIYQRI